MYWEGEERRGEDEMRRGERIKEKRENRRAGTLVWGAARMGLCGGYDLTAAPFPQGTPGERNQTYPEWDDNGWMWSTVNISG